MANEARFRSKVNMVSFLCAVLVVFLHSYAFNDGPQPILAYHVEFFLSRVLAQSAVPVFFALSAFLFYRNFTLEKLPGKWKSRLTSLVIPYLLWNLISMGAFWLLAKLPFINTPSFDITPRTLYQGVVLYQYNLTFWFVFNLILLTYLCPLLYALLKNRYVGICFLGILVWMYGIEFSGISYLETRSVLFYSLGAYCALHLRDKVVNGRFHWTGAAAFLLAVVLIYGWDENRFCYIIARLLLIYGVYHLSDLVAEVRLPAFFQCSFPIYAMHNLILETFNKVFSFFLDPGTNWILLDYFGSTVLTVLLICTFNALLLRFTPRLHRILFGGRGQ